MTAVLPDTRNIFGSHPEELVPVFVYGTLRVGEGNYQWASACVVKEVEGALARGQIFFVHGRGGYPVARFDMDGTIIGDVLWCDPNVREFEEMCRMEFGAGYSMWEIEVQLPLESDDSIAEQIKVFGFQYNREPDGERITSGDWKNRQ